MRTPNYFLVGAPKCGTTALSEYLRAHPQVWMSDPKEPHFFCFDFFNRYGRKFDSRERYLEACFGRANGVHRAVGEASPMYYYSRMAFGEIRHAFPEARIIVMLRNPVEMAQSMHSQKVYDHEEDQPDFERAWLLQCERRQGRRIPKTCLEPTSLQYRWICSHGTHMQRLFRHFERERVLVILFEDFQRDTLGVYRTALEFLGADYDGRTEFPRANQNKQVLHPVLARCYFDTLFALAEPKDALKQLLGKEDLGITRRFKELNKREAFRRELSPGFRSRLVEEFLPEVETLESLLGISLESWKR